ncbi:hypothetical protein BT69DRAFT_1278146, partial [Atractiella rhizophila]
LLQIIEYLGRVVSNVENVTMFKVAALAPNEFVEVIRPIVISIVLFCCLGGIGIIQFCKYFKFIQSNTSEANWFMVLQVSAPPYTH